MSAEISAVIITGNEEENIRDCLESVCWAGEIVVLDSKSSDETVNIARRYTDKVYIEEWKGYIAQKNAALKHCTGRWVLSLDADERITEGLRLEIEEILRQDEENLPDGFFIPRRSFYLGRWIRRGGWYPDRKLRLFKRNSGKWVGNGVHERLQVTGRTGHLKNPILHYTYRDISDHLLKMDRYTTIIARHKFSQGKRAGYFSLIMHPLFKFVRMYFLKAGFLEGRAGLIISTLGAYYVFLKYAKLWEYGKSSAECGRRELKT